MIEFLSAMTALDFLLILVWVGVMFLGLRAGMVKILFLIAAIVAGAFAGAALSHPASHLTGPWAGVSADRGLPVTFFGLDLLITSVIFVVLMLTYRNTAVTRIKWLEATIGVVVGFMGGLIAVAQIIGMLAVVTAETWGYMDGARENVHLELTNTPFIPLVSQTFPTVTTAVAGWLPVDVKDTCQRCL